MILFLVIIFISTVDSRVISKRDSSSESDRSQAPSQGTPLNDHEKTVLRKVLVGKHEVKTVEQVLEELDELDRDFSDRIRGVYSELTPKAKTLFDEYFLLVSKFHKILAEQQDTSPDDIEKEIEREKTEWMDEFREGDDQDTRDFRKIYSIFYTMQYEDR